MRAMRVMSLTARARRLAAPGPIAALTCAVAVPWLALSPAAMGNTIASATLQQCATATVPQTERSATFAGEMTAIPGTVRMEMRINLEEQAPGETLFRTITDPSLGVWHLSAAGVKVFAHIQQVTDLSAPALYRGALRFRWLNARNRPIKSEELRTARCEQPAPSAPAPTSTSPSSTGSQTAAAASAGA